MKQRRKSPPDIGAPSWKGSREAYAELLENLWFAHFLYREQGDGGIEGCKTACIAVMRYLAVRHENPQLAETFDAILASFMSVEGGVLPELFDPNREPRKRSRSHLRKHFKLWAAVCLDVRMSEFGEAEAYAAGIVARHVAKWTYMDGQVVSGNTVRHWRNDIYAEPERKRRLRRIVDVLRGRDDLRSFLREIMLNGPPSAPGIKKPS